MVCKKGKDPVARNSLTRARNTTLIFYGIVQEGDNIGNLADFANLPGVKSHGIHEGIFKALVRMGLLVSMQYLLAAAHYSHFL